MAAAGSVWNANSWHWEEKSRTEWGKKELLRLLEGGTLSDGLAVVKANVTGEASVSVRKGKSIVAFEFKVDGEWKGEQGSGKFLISSVDQQEAEDGDFGVTVHVTEGDAALRDVVQKSPFFKQTLKTFRLNLIEREANSEKLAADLKTRSDAKADAAAAATEKGGEKEALLAEQKAQEVRSAPVEAEGSVWNVNSYHWEEKPMTAWAQERLLKLLDNPSVGEIDAGEDTIIRFGFWGSRVTGEASSSIRKGKKILVFEFKIRGNWKATRWLKKGSEETFLADAQGEFRADDFNSEDYSDGEVAIVFAADSDLAARKALNDKMKSEGMAALRAILDGFVVELHGR